MSKRARSPSGASTNERYTSVPIIDRSSTFVASYSPHISARDLQRDEKYSTATHRIAAWRTPSAQRSLSAKPVYDTGHDDDGEKFGGKTLEKVLVAANVTGAVVVARWYGGVMLGPVRFEHIRNCANEAIAIWKAETARPSKQIRMQDDGRKKEQLVAVLKQRDQSISVLRDLLAQKKGQASSSQGAGDVQRKASDYSPLPVAALEKLEQVRDATIGWILKEIEKVEQVDEAEKATMAKKSGESEDLTVKAPSATEKPDIAPGNGEAEQQSKPESKITYGTDIGAPVP
ncbi:MAG: hypothetical protein L6R39_005668 [Caloplaca ligustica]|nr:MAG: hypothetical protein L6R39_005668 [Caloplaca ligustica]